VAANVVVVLLDVVDAGKVDAVDAASGASSLPVQEAVKRNRARRSTADWPPSRRCPLASMLRILSIVIQRRDGNFEVYVMDTDGSNQTRLTNNPAFDVGPAWSPVG
jgi:hypothetical protein